VTRRRFVATAGALGLMPALPPAWCMPAVDATAPRADDSFYRFFDSIEANIVEAACDRLIPGDAASPGALAAGVPLYIDEQLAGPWGAGERTHREGVWQPGTPWHDPGRPSTPRDYFRAALREIHRQFDSGGIPFAACAPGVQETYMRSLENGSAPLSTVSARGFFALLLILTVEGYYSHPERDTSRSTLAWTLHGFAGACVHQSRGCSTPRATSQSQR